MKRLFLSIFKTIKSLLKWTAISLVSILLLGGVGYVIWNAFFYTPNKLGRPITSLPDRVTLTAGADLATERWVTWRAGEALDGEAYVELVAEDTLRIAAAGEEVESRSGVAAAYYRALLTSLRAGEHYRYRVVSGGESSAWSEFAMPREDADTTAFIYIGDVQDNLRHKSKGDFAAVDSLFPKAHLWAFAGDMIQRPMECYWDYWFDSIDHYAREKTIVTTPGNHEYFDGLPFQLDPRWGATYATPANGPEGAAGRSFFVESDEMCFVSFDTSSLMLNPFAMYRHYKWLERVLSESAAKWKFVMFHHAIYSVSKGRNHVVMRNLFRPLFERCGVTMVLQGHDHAYGRRATPHGSEGVAPVYLLSSCSPKSYPDINAKAYDRVGVQMRLMQYVEMVGDTLTCKTVTVDGLLYDHFQITADGAVVDLAGDFPENFRRSE